MFDLIVVGGGVVGARVPKRRPWSPHVARRPTSRGPRTDAGAGIVSPETEIRDGSPRQAMTDATPAFYSDLIDQLARDGEHDTGFVRCGKLVIARDEREAKILDTYLGLLLDPTRPGTVPAAGSIAAIEPKAAHELFPVLGEVTKAFFSRDAARVDGRQLTAALLHAAEGRGLEREARGGDVRARWRARDRRDQ